jgi:hypothetical protein
MTQNFVDLLSTVAPQDLARILRTARQSAERNFMNSITTLQRQSDNLVTVPSVWLEGDSATPSTHVVKAWAPPVNIVLAIFFGRGRDKADSIVNKLSGKALEVEDSSTSQRPRIEHQQVPPNDGPTGSLDVRYVGPSSALNANARSQRAEGRNIPTNQIPPPDKTRWFPLISKMRKLFLTAVTVITWLGLIPPSLVARDIAKNAPVTPNIEKTIKISYGHRKDNHCFIFAKNFAEKLHKTHGIPSKIVTFFFAAWPETGHVFVTYELNGERWAIDNEMAAPVKVTGKTPAQWSAQLQDLPKDSILIDLVIDVPTKSEKEKQYLDAFYKYMLYDLKHNPIWKWSEDDDNLKKNPMQKIFRSISKLFGKN